MLHSMNLMLLSSGGRESKSSLGSRNRMHGDVNPHDVFMLLPRQLWLLAGSSSVLAWFVLVLDYKHSDL